MPAAEEQRDADGAGRDHAGVFGQEEQGEPHRAVFGVIPADQFLLGLGQVERGAVGLGVDADRGTAGTPAAGVKTFHAGMKPEPVVGLLVDDLAQVERAEHAARCTARTSPAGFRS